MDLVGVCIHVIIHCIHTYICSIMKQFSVVHINVYMDLWECIIQSYPKYTCQCMSQILWLLNIQYWCYWWVMTWWMCTAVNLGGHLYEYMTQATSAFFLLLNDPIFRFCPLQHRLSSHDTRKCIIVIGWVRSLNKHCGCNTSNKLSLQQAHSCISTCDVM